MRNISTTVYEFSELSETAQTRAVEVIREKLGGAWWDQADNDDVAACMVYELAGLLHSPGYDTKGAADFPGIEGVSLDGWSVDRHQSLAVSGRLDRENAPALPWLSGLDHVTLIGHRQDSTTVDVVVNDECSCLADDGDPHAEDCLAGVSLDLVGHEDLINAVRGALSKAWTAGEKEAEYKTSEAYARELIEANAYEFTEDGELYA
jgi:hypothetical protein